MQLPFKYPSLLLRSLSLLTFPNFVQLPSLSTTTIMGRVLLKVCPPHIQAAMRKADVATSYIGYHIGRQWVRLVRSASRGYTVSVTLTKLPVGFS